jgi:23S rRNA (adenine-N6)-dimethyltransferase
VRGQRWQAPPSPSGSHFLKPWVAAELVRAARISRGELVFDLGAGVGALTRPLAACGAHVVAVERNVEYVEALRRRCAGVSVVCGDLRTIPLPRRDFRILANIPFATTSALLRRLADWRWLVRADLVVERGAARRFAGTPRDAWAWRLADRYDIRVGRHLAPGCFAPPPPVDAAVLVLRRRST